MVKIEMEATSIADLKKQMKEFLNDEKQKEDTTEKAKKKETPVKQEVPEEAVKEETKTVKEEAKAVKEETKAVKEDPKPEELTDDQKTELRSLCADYIHKVSDGKENIKKFLNTKGVAKVTELKPADLPEFKAMVQI